MTSVALYLISDAFIDNHMDLLHASTVHKNNYIPVLNCIAGNFRMVEIFVYFVLKSITQKLKLTKMSLQNNVNNYVLHHYNYAELYEY